MKFVKKHKEGILLLIIIAWTVYISSCGLNPVPASNVINGQDSLFAPKNNDAIFTFSTGSQTYGSFQLSAYVATAFLSTPSGGGVLKSTENLDIAPDSGYIPSEECNFLYYYMITDMAPHYAKIFITSITQTTDGIDIVFNWWLQTEAGERNFR